MARRIYLAVFGGLLLLAIGHTERAEAQAGDVLQLVNQVRAEYGLPPLAHNSALAAAAQGHANFISSAGVYSHYGVNGSTWQDRAEAAGYPGWAGENLVGGTSLTPQQGVTWWRNSATHFSNMLNPRWTEAGVGLSVGNGQNFYVMVFGTQNEGPPPREEQQVVDVPFIVAPIQLAAPNPDGSIVHTVLEGHTFWAIAARYEVSLADLYLFNGLTADSVLNPGDKLTIRLADGQPPPPTPTPPATHRVREGESLWVIAAYYKTDLATLLWLNGLSQDAVVHPGNEVKVRLLPGEEPPPTPTPQLTHIVKSGDTAWAIALRYGLTLEQLAAFNNIAPDTILQIGQELLVRPPTPTPEPTPTTTPTLTAAPADLGAAALSAVQPTPSPRATPIAIAANTLPEPAPTNWQTIFSIGALIVGVGLIAVAGIAIMVLWRKDT
ncbi:LysM peptidoglycan-binding domain-containing protein [Promineifilum sp.]|uniref:LysM peptidoglycan-binding domain-containing protein n=1 Tax=Promineifilum sp. TaxID=2664178 RepID=UPI0035AD7D42